ncbi:cytotoxic translational repressor of toxin-antitoxin stability system [Ornithinimicrobium cerasi]|uniref:Cytotoxic translational repressor of toxin-antitoxin stability system n=1 Tax=Ornithinimicrobium cerasi TaxID=2248773 RepID=A0A285VKK2_9MICO|nr:cytotoxic translational repressor of toxin-antitoxin stability system [Ornithinimicrobium cerasi]SOC53726.1 hypothetical protein SAMN05421879_10287 [Ornithinimicrobium cerasi]
MSHPAASKSDHERFCRTEGWDLVRNARGGGVGHHLTYELALADGRILRTRISRPIRTSDTYGASLFTHILTDQLDVTADEFWACVKDKVLPPRPKARADAPAQALPASLVHQLITVAGLPEDQVARMTKEEAVDVMTKVWSEGPSAD